MGFCDRRRFKFIITAINHWQQKRILKVERTSQDARGLLPKIWLKVLSSKGFILFKPRIDPPLIV
jgi:hypothetical protein